MRKIIFITLAMVMLVSVMLVGADTACAAAGIKVGDVIQFGRFPWRVLDIEFGRALILTDVIIDEMEYCEHRSQEHSWGTCTIRQYLNGLFLNNNFSEQEKARIAETRIRNDSNQWYGTNGGNSTNDRIFLLSIEEVVRYFGDSGLLRNTSNSAYSLVGDSGLLKNMPSNNAYFLDDQYNSSRIALKANGTASWWWLRSIGYPNPSTYAAFVDYDGRINIGGYDVYNDSGGVRPALWLNL